MTPDQNARPVPFLDATAPIPVDRPFTRAEARAEGVGWRRLRGWVDDGRLLTPVHGVFHAAQLPDGLELRGACLRLVAPPEAVITDETAGWFHGAEMVLAPGDHLVVPRVSMVLPPGRRLRNGLAVGGERTFLDDEVVELEGMRLTSILRTACDLGRRRNSDRAFAGMEAMANLPGFELQEFLERALGKRFHGYRWVCGLRAWAPHVRRGVQSQEESVVRKRWIECPGLPYPEPQILIPGPHGPCKCDMGNEEIRYGVEYYGEQWHGPEQAEHDEERVAWFEREEGWVIDVFRRPNLYGPTQDVQARLHAGVARARRRYGERAWRGQARWERGIDEQVRQALE